ncbi:MAG: hypothetical protein JJU03_00465 [Idiomarina sp.]|nr:hypothetical protein [Idiomarina sp.]
MKKFIGAMILGVVVVIYMVVEMNREHQLEQLPSPNARAVDDTQWSEPQQAEMRPSNDAAEDNIQSVTHDNAHFADDVEVHSSGTDNGYMQPQYNSLADVEAARDRSNTGRNTVDIDLVPYQLQYEAVDYQWFREMEQALYSISYEVLEPIGARMVNLECATSVCVAEFDIPPHADFESAAFNRAAEDMDIFDRENLSMVFLSSEGVVERIIFQRKE